MSDNTLFEIVQERGGAHDVTDTGMLLLMCDWVIARHGWDSEAVHDLQDFMVDRLFHVPGHPETRYSRMKPAQVAPFEGGRG